MRIGRYRLPPAEEDVEIDQAVEKKEDREEYDEIKAVHVFLYVCVLWPK
jgi:hypothetical protein